MHPEILSTILSGLAESTAKARNGDAVQHYAGNGDEIVPTKPLSGCTHPLCPNRVYIGSKCKQHYVEQGRKHDLYRGSRHERGYGTEWERIRKDVLAMQPYCFECAIEGSEVAATEVDHIVPKRRGGTDDYSNLQSLCKHHHSAKTVRESVRR